MDCHFPLQGIFPAQGWNPCPFRLLHRLVGSLLLSHRESPAEVDIYSLKGQSKGEPLRPHEKNQCWILVFSSSQQSLVQSGGELFTHRLLDGFWLMFLSATAFLFPRVEWDRTPRPNEEALCGPCVGPSARLAAILLTEVWQSSSCLPPPAGGFFPFIPTNSQRKHPNKSALFGRLSSQRSFLESQWCQKPI